MIFYSHNRKTLTGNYPYNKKEDFYYVINSCYIRKL